MNRSISLTPIMADFTLINPEQLRMLARILYYKEAEAIHHIKFKSERDREKYLRDCKAGYESAVGLLNAGNELERRFQNEDSRASIARDIFGYIVNGANHALQTVQNYSLRMNYVEKIREHVNMLGNALEVADNVLDVAKEVTEYKEAMFGYARAWKTTPASRRFSRWLQGSGIKFEDLVQRYQAKLKFQGHFKDLKDVQKTQASRGGIVKAKKLSKVFGVAGIAVRLFTAGVVIWEIFLDDNPLQKATREAVVTAASYGGALLGNVIGVALASCAPASPFVVLMTGIITSIAGDFILGGFAGWLVDLIIGSGGSVPLSTDGHRCYVAPLPDGLALARQIAHASSS